MRIAPPFVLHNENYKPIPLPQNHHGEISLWMILKS
jgi:hypothetical protein